MVYFECFRFVDIDVILQYPRVRFARVWNGGMLTSNNKKVAIKYSNNKRSAKSIDEFMNGNYLNCHDYYNNVKYLRLRFFFKYSSVVQSQSRSS